VEMKGRTKDSELRTAKRLVLGARQKRRSRALGPECRSQHLAPEYRDQGPETENQGSKTENRRPETDNRSLGVRSTRSCVSLVPRRGRSLIGHLPCDSKSKP